MNEEIKETGDAVQQAPDAGVPESDEAAREPTPESVSESTAADTPAPAAAPETADSATAVAADEAVVTEEDEAPEPEEVAATGVDDELDDDLDDEDDDEEDDEELEDVEPLELNLDEEPEDEDIEKDWFILKVQSNRETSIRDALARRVTVAGLDRFFGDIIVPTEDVAEFKSGKKKIVKRKMYPGYIVVHMSINDDTWFLVRETPGIGDFTGAAGKPTPMLPHEVDRILNAMKPEKEGGETPKTAIPFKAGDRVRIKEGTFENFEGEVEGIDEANGRVTVMINIFNRTTPAELEHWQIEPL